MTTVPEWTDDINRRREPLVALRRDLHRHPLFLRERPGCYFRVGVQPSDGRPHPHHAPEFELNEDGLVAGLRVALSVMRRALAPHPV